MTQINPFQSLPGYRELVNKDFLSLGSINSAIWPNLKLQADSANRINSRFSKNQIILCTNLTEPQKTYKSTLAFWGFLSDIETPVKERLRPKVISSVMEAIANLPLLSSFITGSTKLDEHVQNWYRSYRNQKIFENTNLNDAKKRRAIRQADNSYCAQVLHTIVGYQKSLFNSLNEYGFNNPRSFIAIATVNKNGSRYLLTESIKIQSQASKDLIVSALSSEVSYQTGLTIQKPNNGDGYPKLSITVQDSHKKANEDEMIHHHGGGLKLLLPGYSNEPELLEPEGFFPNQTKESELDKISKCHNAQEQIFREIINAFNQK